MIRSFPFLFVILWSSAFITSKIIVQDASPFASLAFRFAVVTAGFFCFAAVLKESLLASRKDMLEAAVKARNESDNKSTKLIAVTVLTSLDDKDIKEIGYKEKSEDLVLRLASLAKETGLDGIVCSAKEISLIKRKLGEDFILVVPGIRLDEDNKNDQKRTMSPKNAIDEGADLLVIGRPITESNDPKNTINKILKNIKNDTKD